MKKSFFSFLVLILPAWASAQTAGDAIRYSMSSLAGSARYISLGGAFGALGADMSSIGTNPGGIAVYRKSELSLSPAFYYSRTGSDYFGSSSSDTRYNMNFGHAGAVFTYRLTKNEETAGWKNWNFGIVYNRMDNYQSRSLFNGYNPDNSLLDYYLQKANVNGGLDPKDLDQYYEYQAYQTYLINPDSTGHYSSVAYDGNVQQRRSATTKGSRAETAISFGGNYSNKLFLGVNIGIASLRYVDNAVYEEVDKSNHYNDTLSDFKSFTLNENVTTRGYGVNFKFGLIYKPNEIVRIGMAIHSPTFFSMHDEYYNETRSYYDNGDNYSYVSDLGLFDYDLKTPFRAVGSLAFVIGKYGLISGDAEFVDYTEADLNSPTYKFFDQNNQITTTYTSAANFRFGTEWVVEGVSLRGGYAHYGSPLKYHVYNSSYDMSRQYFTGGIGFRDRGYFIDFGYAYGISKYVYFPYVLEDNPSLPANKQQDSTPFVLNKQTTHNFTITLGVKF